MFAMALPPQSLSEHFSGVVTSQMRPFDVVQSLAKQEQLSVLGNVPSLMRHGSKGLHNDVELVQYKPVLRSEHSVVPHRQLSVLGNVPSLMRHGSKGLQTEMELVQYKPVLLEHPVVPHRQAAGLAVIPLVRSHGGPAAHVLVD